MADLKVLISEADQRGIKVLLDLVANHTSIEHPWFINPRTRRSYYVWSDQPNNWLSTFHVSSWTYDDHEEKYYLHSYLPEQPDLNWRDEEVRTRFDEILRYWFDRGVAGFRIDACYLLIKDLFLRNNPRARRDDHMWDRNRGQRPVWNANQPETHTVLRRWRRIADTYRPTRLLMGATWVPNVEELATYYGHGEELQLPQYPQLLFTPFQPLALRQAVEEWLAVTPPGESPVWFGSSHDFSRFPSRWCDEDPALIRTALTFLLTLPGACILYQGDEIGLPDMTPSRDRMADRSGQCRDAYRSPMPWDRGPTGGFTTGQPWLPLGNVAACNTADQMDDPGSVLHHTRWLIKQKKRLRGPYKQVALSDDCWCYQRGNTRITLDFRPDRSKHMGLREVITDE
jgi:alpha-glucosidase